MYSYLLDLFFFAIIPIALKVCWGHRIAIVSSHQSVMPQCCLILKELFTEGQFLIAIRSPVVL